MKCNNCGKDFIHPLTWIAPLMIECENCKAKQVIQINDLFTLDLSSVSDNDLLAEVKKRGL